MEGTILVLRKNKSFTFICMLALVLVTIGILAPYIAPHDPLKTDMINSLKGPILCFH